MRDYLYGNIHKALDSDTIDGRHEKHVTKGCLVIGNYMKQQKQATVGELRRTFPEFERVVWQVLGSLRLGGVVDYSDYQPLTTIYYRSRRPVTPSAITVGWNGSYK